MGVSRCRGGIAGGGQPPRKRAVAEEGESQPAAAQALGTARACFKPNPATSLLKGSQNIILEDTGVKKHYPVFGRGSAPFGVIFG